MVLGSHSVLAAEVQLFANGQQVEAYDRRLGQVQPGDILNLDGAQFTVVAKLGSGNTTQIFDIGNEQALRVPIASGLFNNLYDYRNYITAYLKGYRTLHALGVNVVQVDEPKSRAPDYLVVNKVSTKMNLREFLDRRDQLPEPEKQAVDNELRKFAASTASLSSIGDFHAGQLSWTGTEWILMDFTSSSTPAVTVQARTAFDNFNLPYAYKSQLIESIREQRRQLGFEEGRVNRPQPLQCQRLMR